MPARLLITISCLLILSGCSDESPDRRLHSTTKAGTIVLPAGVSVSPEGSLGAGEWQDADTVRIRAGEKDVVTVLLKQDASNLLVRFTGVKTKTREYFPVLLVDRDYSRDSGWRADDMLLEVSYQDCEARGHPDSLTCTMLRKSWFANNFPTPEPGIIEMKIAGSYVGLELSRADTIGLAIGVRTADGERVFWPETAELARPGSWGTVIVGAK